METPVITDTVSHYTVLKKLGAGGMGEVYLAEDTVLDRRVAVKFLAEDSAAGQQAMRSLIREAQAAARLDHPNICTIHEVGEEAGRGFIVMEYVEGETLACRLRKKPLDLSECLEIAVQVADALAEAHSQGITHRDVTPQNIMLTAHHQAKVIDFGLAKVIPDRSRVDSEAVTESLLIDPRVIVGTVTYMSPEQARGKSLDARSDIFSFGAVLYEMITGHQAFAADSTAMTISAIVNREPAPLKQYSSSVPTELERIVSKALQKARQQRYQTIQDLLIDLRSLKHHVELKKEFGRSLSLATGEGLENGADTAANETTDAVGRTSTQTARAAAHREGEFKFHPRGLFIPLLVGSTLVFVIAGLIYQFYLSTNVEAIDSIAVLPLVNVSGDANTDYLSDGITEALINSLTELQQLKVIARATAFRYKGKDVDPQAVGSELGVRAILMGRVRQMGDMLNIQVDLVDAATGAQLWGREYERKVSDVLSVKQSIAREVTQKLRLGLSGEQQQQLTKRDTTNTEAYQFYLRGRYFWNKRTAEGLKKAIEQFQQAIEKDPNYALAYVGLADCYALLERFAGAPSSETLPKARAAVQRVLEIDDSLEEAHRSLAWIEQNSWNFSEAEREYKRAIELNPNYETAHLFYSFYLRHIRGRVEDGMAEIKFAQRLDPLSANIDVNLAQAYMHKGELDASVEESKRIIELDSSFAEAHRILGIAYRKLGRHDEAIAELETAARLDAGGSWPLADLGVCYAVAGKKARAGAVLKELEERYHKGEALGQNLAHIYAALGKKEQAFAWLEKDFEARSGFLPTVAYAPQSDVLRDALSSDPRWNDLLRRIGLLQ